jgi:hypothetical protein
MYCNQELLLHCAYFLYFVLYNNWLDLIEPIFTCDYSYIHGLLLYMDFWKYNKSNQTRRSRPENIWGVRHSMWIRQSSCGPDIKDYWNYVWRTQMTPAPWPGRKIRCSRTPIKYRARNPIWKNTQTEQDGYVHQPDCERSCRNTTTSRNFQQGGWLHIKSYMVADN